MINNLLVALVDNSSIMSFPLILTAKIFHNSSYQIFDVDTPEKRIEIHPGIDRPVCCVSKGSIKKEDLASFLPKEFKLEENEIFISGTTDFAE